MFIVCPFQKIYSTTILLREPRKNAAASTDQSSLSNITYGTFWHMVLQQCIMSLVMRGYVRSRLQMGSVSLPHQSPRPPSKAAHPSSSSVLTSLNMPSLRKDVLKLKLPFRQFCRSRSPLLLPAPHNNERPTDTTATEAAATTTANAPAETVSAGAAITSEATTQAGEAAAMTTSARSSDVGADDASLSASLSARLATPSDIGASNNGGRSHISGR